MEFRRLASEDNDIGKMIRNAQKLEGSIRNTGIHACGVIITPQDITNYVPVSVAKDSELLVSQYDNSVAEDAGLLKMDFLGLKTLTIIKDAVDIIRERYGDSVDIDNISLEDEKTFELFQKGETIGLFQYESPGMQKYLKDLKPTKFEDLIAMNALYRPGPIQYIPAFINRKNGLEEIVFDLPDMEEYLAETYGITVYQEQVMLLSQKLAGFSKGDADKLRKAMGKKLKAELDKLYPKFVEGCKNKGHDEEKVKKIWKDWEAFASYAFNKSHSTCYAYIAFQTGYLKAHYPEAYMAAVLNNNKNDISKINFFLQETRRMGIKVLGPDINESNIKFTVNNQGHIRFGLSALKGVGEGPVEEIVAERRENGVFSDVYDMMRRLNLRSVNKKCLDSLVLGGAMDSFGEFNRAQYFTSMGERGENFIEFLLKYGSNYQAQQASSQMSLFGDAIMEYMEAPRPPKVEEWNQIEKLEKEKEVTGIYISGHPLDDYHLEFKNFLNCTLDKIDQTENKQLKVGGIVTDVYIGTSQKGTEYSRFTIQDFNGSYQFNLYTEKHESYKHLLEKGKVLYIEGINEKRYNQDNYYFKVNDIRLLDSVGKALTKSVTVRIPLHLVDEKAIHELTHLVESHSGPHQLRFKLVDLENHFDVNLISKDFTVLADYAFVDKIERMGWLYKIN
jgi:DNA polymerase-3 subunit alpha